MNLKLLCIYFLNLILCLVKIILNNINTFQYYRDGPRIEAAFRKYFHRADFSQKNDSYTILVCHANVIRYFVCRYTTLYNHPHNGLVLNVFPLILILISEHCNFHPKVGCD